MCTKCKDTGITDYEEPFHPRKCFKGYCECKVGKALRQENHEKLDEELFRSRHGIPTDDEIIDKYLKETPEVDDILDRRRKLKFPY